MNQHMDLLGDLLTTRPIQTGWEMCIEPHPNRQFWCIENQECWFGNSLHLTQTQTRCDGLELLLTLRVILGAPEDDDRVISEIHSEAVMKWVLRFTWRGHDNVNLKAVMEQVRRYTARPWLSRPTSPRLWWSEIGDALWEAIIVCTWRAWLKHCGDTFGGSNWLSSELNLETDIEWTQRCISRS